MNAAEVAKWASGKGFQEFAPALLQHQIRFSIPAGFIQSCLTKPLNDSGAILPMLGEPQLREIGFGLVGPRMQFQKELREIQRGVSALPCIVMGLSEPIWMVPGTYEAEE